VDASSQASRTKAVILIAISLLLTACTAARGGQRSSTAIDRYALVTRHNPVLHKFDIESPLSVGNGEFAFTVDVTGLQTFPEGFESTIPLGTLSNWGWHTAPNPDNWTIEKFKFAEFDSHGRKVGYADIPGDKRTPEINWLRTNPHRLHLGQIGMRLSRADGTRAQREDLKEITQTLDLWNGAITSRFVFEGTPVEVVTLCDSRLDAIAVHINSTLIQQGRLAVEFRFPYGTGATTAADWTKPEAHSTEVTNMSSSSVTFRRRLDNDSYLARVDWSGKASFNKVAAHDFVIEPEKQSTAFEFVCAFSSRPSNEGQLRFEAISQRTKQHWNKFWSEGGAIDLSESTDERWRELERRIVLSQYLTAIQCAGTLPPQETALTFNSWEGKFHLEMHWWHAAHFALWNRIPMFERSLDYYQRILPKALATARRQGYEGARWPKMTSPSGDESPSSVGPFLIWQEPHPIYYAELCYRAHPNRQTLEKYKEVVFATADFMASFAWWDESSKRYILGPPLNGAQEVFPKDRTINLTYELTYWRWGLEAAQTWAKRMGIPPGSRWPGSRWNDVAAKLSRPLLTNEQSPKYLFAESAPDTYTNSRWKNDHPAVLMAYGMLPGPGIDREAMSRTFDWIWANWNWPDTWGWDYPMVAMSAARLGKPERAIDALLLDTPKNQYRVNGHNHQRPGLTIYLPGNGGLLAAVAMMAAGWDDGPRASAPGFPQNGRWTVRFEKLNRMP